MDTDYLDEELEIDPEVRAVLDARLLAWQGVSTAPLLGGVGYAVRGGPFAALLEGVVAMSLPRELVARALTLAGVSPLPAARDDPRFAGWTQFLLLLAEDVDAVMPWLKASYDHVSAQQVGCA